MKFFKIMETEYPKFDPIIEQKDIDSARQEYIAFMNENSLIIGEITIVELHKDES